MVIMSGAIYPGLITEFAQYVVPGSANGSLITGPNGTVIGSELLGQNITCNPAAYPNVSECPFRGLFWSRPSLTDYQSILGAGNETPYNPTNPALRNQTLALYNQTIYYMQLYGVNNITVPIDQVSESESGLDPDLLPQAALVQVYRVAYFANQSGLTNITIGALTNLVDANIDNFADGYIGVPYVNVVQLDIALLHLEGVAT
jgi:K+-transporting ATPase ATPase C chain